LSYKYNELAIQTFFFRARSTRLSLEAKSKCAIALALREKSMCAHHRQVVANKAHGSALTLDDYDDDDEQWWWWW
jgi:hypothetical protein